MCLSSKKRILMIIASQQFRDEELFVPKAYFEQKGYQVTVASSKMDAANGMLGAVINPDTLLRSVQVEDYCAIVFVGGNGAVEYWDDQVAWEVAQKANGLGNILGAICIAPVTLARAGLLKNKKATVWSSEKTQLENNGAFLSQDDVVQDGKLITANGPEAAERFAEKIINALSQHRKV